MEMVNVQEMLQKVNESIQSITRVLQGTEMLTPKTQKEAMELLKGQVPAIWQKAWEGPENPTNWIRLINKKS